MMLVGSPALALLLALSSCGGGGPTDPPGDTTPPTVVSVSPASGSQDVSRSSTVAIEFSESISSASVSAASITSLPAISGSFAVDSNQVTFSPSTVLSYGTSYEFTVGTGVTDLAGNALRQPYAWTFRTEDDPATTIPYVTVTDPANNALSVDAAEPISATFSKAMDPISLTASSFYLSPATPGTFSYNNMTVTFTPDDTLSFNTLYTATITTAAADTFGNHLSSNYVWRFTTGDDPYIPQAFVTRPSDNAIIGDTVTISVLTQHPVGVARVEFYIDNVHQAGQDDTSEPFEFLWDASGYEINSEHTVFARAYDADGRLGVSDTVLVTYLWDEIRTDANDDQRVDIKRLFARSSDTLLELRYEFWENWVDPTADTALDLGIFLDADQNGTTGFTHFTSDGTYINDIGAEYRVIIGIHGYEAWAEVAADETNWVVLGGPEALAYYNVPADTNVLEIGIRWEAMNFPNGVDLVCNNVFFINAGSILRDWVPNLGSGHLTILRENRYLGETYPLTSPAKVSPGRASTGAPANPFD